MKRAARWPRSSRFGAAFSISSSRDTAIGAIRWCNVPRLPQRLELHLEWRHGGAPCSPGSQESKTSSIRPFRRLQAHAPGHVGERHHAGESRRGRRHPARSLSVQPRRTPTHQASGQNSTAWIPALSTSRFSDSSRTPKVYRPPQSLRTGFHPAQTRLGPLSEPLA